MLPTTHCVGGYGGQGVTVRNVKIGFCDAGRSAGKIKDVCSGRPVLVVEPEAFVAVAV